MFVKWMAWTLQNNTFYPSTLVLSPSEVVKFQNLTLSRHMTGNPGTRVALRFSLVLCFNQLVMLWAEIVGSTSRHSSVWTTLWLCSHDVTLSLHFSGSQFLILKLFPWVCAFPLNFYSPVLLLPVCQPPSPPSSRNLKSLLTLTSLDFIWVKWSLELFSA